MIRFLLKLSVTCLFIWFFWLLVSGTCFADVYLNVEVRKTAFQRHAYYPDKTDWRGYTGLNWGFKRQQHCDILCPYWENTVYAYGDNAQYRHVGWEWEAGLTYNRFSVFYYHHSEHAMDANNVDIGHPDKWPIEDSFGIKVDLIND